MKMMFFWDHPVFLQMLLIREVLFQEKKNLKKTLIKKGVTIGANSTVICGITINEFAFIGAGAVVTKNVEAYALFVGNPAKQIGWMSEQGTKLSFDKNGFATCAESGSTYQLKDNIVTKL